ncbi:glycosyltransferase [Muribacter muris]|uniref:glycosyltransferase n=1 Tax=Muribacter muris TaxID=67855 RepID=UPI001883D3D1|nr:glycosyltransferase [Muribacter muris]MBF0828154.1 glycosyltransferase [Muribacter muris]
MSISFIVPVYNVEKYLAACLDSLLAQTVSKEIIIINDGSTDNSLAVAQDYFARYACISVLNQKNQGISAARNAGLKLAKGRYVYFVDSDDWIVEPHLDKMVEIADQHNAVLLKGTASYSYEDGSGRVPYVRPFESKNIGNNQYEIMTGYRHLHDMLSRDWLPSCCFGFFNTEFLRRHGLQFREDIKIGEDAVFMTEVLTCEPEKTVIEVGRVFYHYRLRPHSLTTTKNDIAKLINLFEVSQLFISFYEKQRAAQVNEQMLTDLQRIVAINYGIAYRYQYLSYTPENKAKVRHYFTPEIIRFMQRFLSYEVIL